MNRIVPLFLILSITACGVTGPDEVTLRLEGTVTAQATGQPVAGAQVNLFEYCLCFDGSPPPLATVTTDAQGRYALTKSVDERACQDDFFGFAVRASATGFASETADVERCDGTLERLDVVLPPPSTGP